VTPKGLTPTALTWYADGTINQKELAEALARAGDSDAANSEPKRDAERTAG